MKIFLFVLMAAASYAYAETPVYATAADPPPPLPYAAAYPAGDVAPGPYVQQYNSGPEGFNVQSGFEGYLVPSASGKIPLLQLKALKSVGTGLGGLGLLKVIHSLKKFGLKVVPKVAAVVGALLLLFLIGGVFTTSVCTYTPFCAISFLGFAATKETIRGYMTEDRLTQAAKYIMDSVHKYKDMFEDSPDSTQEKNEVK